MTNEQATRAVLLEALKHVQQNPQEAIAAGTGICGAVKRYLSGRLHEIDGRVEFSPQQHAMLELVRPDTGLTSTLAIAFRTWPEYSGNWMYPIRAAQRGQLVSHAYAYTFNTCRNPKNGWSPDHPYGAARLRLLQHLIDWYEGRAGEQQDQEES